MRDDDGRRAEPVEIGRRGRTGSAAPASRRARSRARAPGRRAGCPAVYVRVSVTASTWTVTSTFPVLAAATTPDGSASATLWTTSRVAPETAHGRGVGLGQLRELVRVAFDRDDERVDLDRGDPEALRGRAGHDRVHRQRPRLAVGEQRDRHVDGARVELDAGDDRARRRRSASARRSRSKSMPSGDSATFDVRGDDLVDGRGRARHGDRRRREGHLADVDARRGGALVHLDGDLLGRHLVEHDLDRARLPVEDGHPRIDGVDRDPDVDGLPVGLDVREVDGRLEVLGALAGRRPAARRTGSGRCRGGCW